MELRHETQYNDTQHDDIKNNDTQNNGINCHTSIDDFP